MFRISAGARHPWHPCKLKPAYTFIFDEISDKSSSPCLLFFHVTSKTFLIPTRSYSFIQAYFFIRDLSSITQRLFEVAFVIPWLSNDQEHWNIWVPSLLITLESGINVVLHLFIFGLFSRGYTLIEGGYVYWFLDFFFDLFKGLYLLFLTNNPGAKFIEPSLFKGLRLFRTLE